MARLLVLAKNNTGRRGEVIAVKPDRWKWGRKEVEPTFVRVDLPGVPVERLAYLIEPDLVWDIQSGKWINVARRKVGITDVDGSKSATTEAELRLKVSSR